MRELKNLFFEITGLMIRIFLFILLRYIIIYFRSIFMKLKEIRKEKKLSVPELSNLSGVPVRTIEDLEKRGDGRVSTLIKLSDALAVSLDELCR